MVEFGILTSYTIKQGGTFSYYGFGKNYNKLIENIKNNEGIKNNIDGSIKNYIPLDNKLDTPIKNNIEQINQSTKNQSIKNYSIKYNKEFDEIWKLYPRKQGKAKALQSYIKARKNGVDFDTIKKGVENYSRYVENNRIEQEYIKHGSTWFNQQCWDDDYSVVEKEKRGNYTFGGTRESKSTWGCTGEASYDIEELMKIK